MAWRERQGGTRRRRGRDGDAIRGGKGAGLASARRDEKRGLRGGGERAPGRACARVGTAVREGRSGAERGGGGHGAGRRGDEEGRCAGFGREERDEGRRGAAAGGEGLGWVGWEEGAAGCGGAMRGGQGRGRCGEEERGGDVGCSAGTGRLGRAGMRYGEGRRSGARRGRQGRGAAAEGGGAATKRDAGVGWGAAAAPPRVEPEPPRSTAAQQAARGAERIDEVRQRQSGV